MNILYTRVSTKNQDSNLYILNVSRFSRNVIEGKNFNI